jgi:hypothetical protein
MPHPSTVHGRILTAPDWSAAVELAADSWAADDDGAGLYAYRRSDVAALNEASRRRVAGARRVDLERDVDGFAPGDWVVQLAPDDARCLVNSQRGLVVGTDGDHGFVDVVWDDCRRLTLSGNALDKHHLSLGYAVTVHKSQGTVSGAPRSRRRKPTGRSSSATAGDDELAYVAMSRARHDTAVVAVADDVDQAVEQLRDDWHAERRERWLLDTEQTLTDALDRLERTTAERVAEAFDESTADPFTPCREPWPAFAHRKTLSI